MARDENFPRTRQGGFEKDDLLDTDALKMADAASSETRADGYSVRVVLVLVAGVGLLLASLAPSVTIGVHVLHEPLSFENWTFSYPLTAVGLAGVAFLWSSLRGRPLRSWPRAIWPLTLLVLWSLLSVLWSVTPDLTGSRALTAVGIAAFGAWFGYELRFDEQLLALALFSAAATLGSCVLIMWWPDLGRGTTTRYGWQGVFAGPNSMGPAVAIGIVVAIGITIRYRRPWIVATSAGAVLVDLVLLQQSKSMTAVAGLVVGAAAGVVSFAVWRLRTRGTSGLAVGTSVALLGGAAFIAVFTQLGSIASFLGQDPTLAGRTLIWSDVRQFISDRPIRGYGFWAIWDNADYTGASYERLGVNYASAHNSVLEIAVGLGAVGVVLFGAVVLAAVVAVSLRVWRFGDLATIGWAVLLAAVITEHLLESFVLYHSYVWMLLIAAAFLPTSSREAMERWGSDEI